MAVDGEALVTTMVKGGSIEEEETKRKVVKKKGKIEKLFIKQFFINIKI